MINQEQKNKVIEETLKDIKLITCNESIAECETCERRVQVEIGEAIEKVLKLERETLKEALKKVKSAKNLTAKEDLAYGAIEGFLEGYLIEDEKNNTN